MLSAPNAVMYALPPETTITKVTATRMECDMLDDSAYASRTSTNTSSDNFPSDNEYNNGIDPRKRSVDQENDDIFPVSKRRIIGIIKPPPLVYPKSYYKGYRHELGITDERTVRNESLLNAESDETGSVYFILTDFRVYRPEHSKRRPWEMVPLNNLNVARASDSLYVDGVLSNGKDRQYVQRMLVDTLSIDYEDIPHDKELPRVWLKSCLGYELKNDSELVEVWYELEHPAEEYVRYYEPFVWLASFAKYFVDYVDFKLHDDEVNVAAGQQDVTLSDFKSDFTYYLKNRFGGMKSFESWHARYNRDDFRTAISANRDWLWNQTHGISLPRSKMRTITLWDEILHLKAIKPVPQPPIDDTVVTPYVHKCFEKLFTTKLKVVIPAQPNQELLGIFIPPKSQIWTDAEGNYLRGQYTDPKLGDVVAFERDEVTKWQSSDEGGDLWFGYITGITPTKSGLNIIWIYKPNDTILCGPNGEYPHKNELFFSDHCNCDTSEATLLTKDIVGVMSVNFFGDPENKDAEYFIRSKYQTGDPGFLSLKQSDLDQCACVQELEDDDYTLVRTKYRCGHTVLLNDFDQESLVPAVIYKFHDETSTISVRILERARTEARNELVFTHRFKVIEPGFINRTCRIRVFLQGEVITTPYDRHGTGDCFYIRCQSLDNGLIVPFTSHPPETELIQGFILGEENPLRPLRGLDLFCGGGNFGRGLEEGGAVDMKWAVDIESAPLHSYRANLKNIDSTAMYLGSINNYLKDAIRGNYSDIVAPRGEVEFISAGSPCQGFSNANGQKNSERSIQNCSLVSTLATAIDIYRPRYALLENVSGLATTRNVGDRQCNVFSTLLCCIVGMGYQCQQFILDSWSHGNPQSRTRLFLAVSAPGDRPLTRPSRSHRHPKDQKALGLYKAPNGLTFGTREMEGLCSFDFRTTRECFEYLPNIHEDHVGICIAYPDHRCSREEAESTRTLLAHIPCYPEKQGWYTTIVRNRLDPSLRPYEFDKEKGKALCKSWQRIPGGALCRTITTTLTPQCSRTGQWVHYDQPRLLTIQEARIAQGFPDDEVLIGEPARQFKIVGNSVARGVSLAMGLALRKAYFGE